jgi:hypothetical protein
MAATATGTVLAVTGQGLPARRRWLPALGLIAVGGIAIAATLDKIR